MRDKSDAQWCAGVYCKDVDIAGLAQGLSVSGGVKPYSLDETNAKRLWMLSEEMLGFRFPAN